MNGVGMLVGNFELKETYLGVAQAFFLFPKRDHVIGYIFIFFRVQP